jgi:hypothetical protein
MQRFPLRTTQQGRRFVRLEGARIAMDVHCKTSSSGAPLEQRNGRASHALRRSGEKPFSVRLIKHREPGPIG